MNISELYLCRALCCDNESSNLKDFKWKEGYLGWIETMGYPIISDETEEKDTNIYYIGCREPNSIADWGLPFFSYPSAKFYIPNAMRHTITKYTGYKDLHGIKVFNGDIIQNIDFPEICYYVEDNEVHDENDMWGFLREYATPNTNNFDCFVVVGNVFEWERLNKEALDWFKTTNYYKRIIRGD